MPENSKEAEKGPIKSEFSALSWKTLFWEVFLFLTAIFLGIAAAFKISGSFEAERTGLPEISFWQFVFYFLFATLFILSVSYFLKLKKRKGAVFKALFVLAVFFGGLLFLEVWLPQPLPLVLITALIFWWWRSPLVLNQNILMVLGMAGVGAVLGLSFQPLMVIFLLLAFSIYDFIAVYKTKHMVKMAREMSGAGAIMGLISPAKASGFKAKLKQTSLNGRFLILGGGDVVFPLILCASLVPYGVFQSLIVAFFSALGLIFGFCILACQKTRQPIPALPPIALFSTIGYLITFLLN